MKDAGDYLAYVKALAIASSQVTGCVVMREEVESDGGLLRMQLTLADGSILETFERFEIVNGNVQVAKYRYHWQDEAVWGGFQTRPNKTNASRHLKDACQPAAGGV